MARQNKVLPADFDELYYVCKFEEGLDINKEDELDEFVLRRRKRVLNRVDRSRSRAQKKAWRINKKERKKALARWAESTKGKRFHKQLGRFNKDRAKRENMELPFSTRDMIALCSLKTNLLIFSEYVVPNVQEQADIILFVEDSMACIDNIMSTQVMDDDSIKTITQLLNPSSMFNLCETNMEEYAIFNKICKEVFPV